MLDLNEAHDQLDTLRRVVERLNHCRASGVVPRTEDDALLIEGATIAYRCLHGMIESFMSEPFRCVETRQNYAIDLGLLPHLMEAFSHVVRSGHHMPLDGLGAYAACRHIIGQVILLENSMLRPPICREYRVPENMAVPAEPRRAPISADIRRQALERDRNRCVECGAIDDLCLDHIHPWSKGGPDDLENFQVLCRSCNSSKRDKVEITLSGE